MRRYITEFALLTPPKGRLRTMGCGRMKVACDDGFEVVTKDKGELVAVTQWHVEHAHHKKVSEAEVMAMSKHP
jgi:hypothetical protein